MSKGDRQLKYRTVANDLRAQILTGRLSPGDRLPSYAEGRSQGITQPTIERAHAVLEREGLIVRYPRRGTYVAAKNPAKGHASRPLSGIMEHTVAVLVNDIRFDQYKSKQSEGWAHVSAVGVIDELRRAGRNGLVLSSSRFQDRDLAHLRENPPSGMVVVDPVGASRDLRNFAISLKSIDCPIVVSSDHEAFTDFDRVVADHEQGAYDLTTWLIDRGCKRILNFWPDDGDHYWLRLKWLGFLRAIREADIVEIPPVRFPVAPPIETWTDQLFSDEVRRFAGYLLEPLTGPNRVDAIMASTDCDALMLCRACRHFGLELNRDVIVTGYDNYWQEHCFRTWQDEGPAATVEKDNRLIGVRLVELLKARIAGNLGDTPVRLPVEQHIVMNLHPTE